MSVQKSKQQLNTNLRFVIQTYLRTTGTSRMITRKRDRTIDKIRKEIVDYDTLTKAKQDGKTAETRQSLPGFCLEIISLVSFFIY